MHIMKIRFSAILFSAAVLLSAEVRNGDFSRTGGNPPTEEIIQKRRSDGNRCPDRKDWASSWGCIGKNGFLQFPKDQDGNRFARISGKNFSLTGYHGRNISARKNLVLGISLRGRGTLRISFWCYKLEDRKAKFMTGGIPACTITTGSKTWTKYLIPLEWQKDIFTIHPVFTPLEGTIDIDNVFIRSQTDCEDFFALAKAEEQLRKSGLFQAGDKENYSLDEQLNPVPAAFLKQEQALKDYAAKNPQDHLAAKLLKQVGEIRPYLLTDGATGIGKDRLNRAAALCIAIEKITGSPAGLSPLAAAVPENKTAAAVTASLPASEKELFLISEVKPDKLLYVENENGNVSLIITSRAENICRAVLQTVIHSGIDDKRPVRMEQLTLRPGKNRHQVSFNAGPESFGREIELKLIDLKGKLLASAREYFQVHSEYMRVMMHGTSRYQNFVHYFAHEQTDFGVQQTADRIYLSCQPLYRIDRAAYCRRIKNMKNNRKVKVSFYQNRSFGGQVGLEQARRHPEFLLYGENGQPDADPFYGGTPNPFEIAAPAELEPVRRKKLLAGRDFLDVRLSSWQHFSSDFTNMECLAYGAECIRKYMKMMNIDVIYLDGTPSVMPGYTWEGKYNISGLSRKGIASLNARIAAVWNHELRKDNPGAGTWCNGISPGAVRWFRGLGMWEKTMGMGIDIDKGNDVSDEYVRTMTAAYNSAFLAEIQHIFMENKDIPERDPAVWRSILLERRDYLIQKYHANVVFGYIYIPGSSQVSRTPKEYAWPTVNYFQALTAATQHHHILYGAAPGIPAVQPFDQFMTRYSGLIWDKDLVAMPGADAEKNIRISSSHALDWKDFVYTRKDADSQIIVIHLVRPYPLKKWDLNWNIPASVLKNVQVEIAVPAGKAPLLVKAMRPYLPNEKPEIMEQKIPFEVENGKVTFRIPSFSYYTMLAVKFR